MCAETINPLRRRMIDDMTVRGFGTKTRHDCVWHVRTFSALIGHLPDRATAEEVRRFQLHQAGPVSARRASTARFRPCGSSSPPEDVTRLIEAAPRKYRAA
jgi:hypothetical protein